jgi:hypothetical protein
VHCRSGSWTASGKRYVLGVSYDTLLDSKSVCSADVEPLIDVLVSMSGSRAGSSALAIGVEEGKA